MQTDIYKLMAEVEDKHWWFISRGKIVKKIIDKFVHPTKKLRILDAGCGSGGNFKMLSQYGEVIGLEPEKQAVEFAKNRNIAKKVHEGYLDANNYKIRGKKFDLIVMTDVLEHINKDHHALQTIKHLLKEDGKYIMTVPAFMFLWGEHDIEHHHQRRYTRKELKKKFADAGFNVHYMSYFNFWLFHIIAPIRKIQAITKKYDKKSTLKIPNPILNSILKFIFTTERFFLGKFHLPYGISIIACVSKKKK